MKKIAEKKYIRRSLFGRHPLTVGAVILLGLSVYELWIRFDDFYAWFKGVRHLSEVRGTPFLDDLFIILEEPEMRMLGLKMLYLLAMIIFGIVCIVRRNRHRGMIVVFILTLLSAAGGILLEIYSFSSWVQIIKLIPLALMAIGSFSNMAQGRKHYRDYLRELNEPPARTPQSRSF